MPIFSNKDALQGKIVGNRQFFFLKFCTRESGTLPLNMIKKEYLSGFPQPFPDIRHLINKII